MDEEFETFNYFKHWKEFIKRNVCITYETKEKRIELFEFLQGAGYIWMGGSQLLVNGKATISSNYDQECYFHNDRNRLTKSNAKNSTTRVVVFKEL